jgi:Ser/Thr protein kinase RdoA (MazF antagonist)
MISPEPFLPLWPETAGRRARLINHTENHTFLVDGGHVLRVHPPSRSRDAIADELRWIGELRAATGITMPEQVGPVHQVDGSPAVLFRLLPGHEPEPSEAVFLALGRWAATLHNHAGQGPHRPVWDERLLDADGPWGDWRAMGTGLGAVDAELRRRLASYGKSPDRFGLIHADMRLANVLDDHGRYALIDFDDCGIGWFMYDFGSAVSFLDTNPDFPAFADAWLTGYTTVRRLAAEDIAILPTMVLLRRMALVAWIGRHLDTDLGQEHAPRFALDTLRLADQLL